MRPTFDTLDYQIILQLREDARRLASDIARALGANERTVRKRINRLVQVGAVRLTAILDPVAFDYLTAVDIFLEIDPVEEEQVIAQLEAIPEISYIAFGQGTRDLSIEGRFKSNQDMYDFLRLKLPAIPGLQVKGYALVPRILRNIDEWIPPASDFLPPSGRGGEIH